MELNLFNLQYNVYSTIHTLLISFRLIDRKIYNSYSKTIITSFHSLFRDETFVDCRHAAAACISRLEYPTSMLLL